MSYCKTQDIYLYRNGDYYVCHECKLNRTKEPNRNSEPVCPAFDTPLEAIDHLRSHLHAHHKVTPRAFIELWKEIERRGEANYLED